MRRATSFYFENLVKMWCMFLLYSLSLLSSDTTASFLYGQPCSHRNTAYLYPNGFVIPPNQINCVDVSRSLTVNPANNSEFFESVWQADTLYADHMNLSRFPATLIYVFPGLEMLDLSSNDIKRLPYKMYKIAPRVTKLLLAENQVFVPRKRGLFKSVSVRMLMLSKNRITNIYPVTFAKMPNLEILYLDGNRLKYVSADMFLPMLGLQYLHLGHNSIAEFPLKEQMPHVLKFYITKDQRNTLIKK